MRQAFIDVALESYVEWREESMRVESAYARWHDAPACDRDLAFSAYVAALDREERACEVHARVMRLT